MRALASLGYAASAGQETTPPTARSEAEVYTETPVRVRVNSFSRPEEDNMPRLFSRLLLRLPVKIL